MKALVTGSSRGIGKAIADKFESIGIDTIRTSTDNLDFTKHESIDAFIDEIKDENISILVNNVGINIVGDFNTYNVDDFDKLMQVNLRGHFVLSQAIVKNMIKHRYGRIVNISSIYGVVSEYQRCAYSTTKAAIIGMTRGMALDLAKYNILVNCVSPGYTKTELTEKILGDEIIKKANSIPLGRMAEPSEIANVVSFLCSSDNSYITGQNIIVDGGYVLR